jgi:hypothetical protein
MGNQFRAGSIGAKVMEALALIQPATAAQVGKQCGETADYAGTYLNIALGRGLVTRDTVDGVYVWSLAGA